VAANVVGANISIDGHTQSDWITPHSFANLQAGPHRVTAAKIGYQTMSQDVTVRAGQDSFVNLNLPPATHAGQPSVAAGNSGVVTQVTSQVGQLTVTSNVVGAEILIDGETQSGWETPHTFERLPAGNHVVAVEKDFYRMANRTVTVPAGGSAAVDLTLDLGTGMAKIVTYPPGLEVFIDGHSQGPSPVIIDISAGHHTYTILGPPGRGPKEDTVDIHPGEYWEKIVRWE
jgi:hypothetical protein